MEQAEEFLYSSVRPAAEPEPVKAGQRSEANSYFMVCVCVCIHLCVVFVTERPRRQNIFQCQLTIKLFYIVSTGSLIVRELIRKKSTMDRNTIIVEGLSTHRDINVMLGEGLMLRNQNLIILAQCKWGNEVKLGNREEQQSCGGGLRSVSASSYHDFFTKEFKLRENKWTVVNRMSIGELSQTMTGDIIMGGAFSHVQYEALG